MLFDIGPSLTQDPGAGAPGSIHYSDCKILIVNYHFSGWLVGWSDWGDWSKCEPFAACGQGFKFRHRNCNAPTPDACQGDPVETAMCRPLVPVEQISTGAVPNSSKDFATSISLAI